MVEELKSKDIVVGYEEIEKNSFFSAGELCYRECDVLHRNEFGKKLFLVYGGVLRQFKAIKAIVYPFNYGIKRPDGNPWNGGIYHNITLLDVAGVGKVYVGCHWYWGHFNFSVYESVEDFNAGKKYEPKYVRFSSSSIESRYGVEIIKSYSSHLYRWIWDGVQAVRKTFTDNIPCNFVYDANGTHFQNGWSKQELSGYATKEECVADNQISVCCFADDEPKEEPKDKVVRLSVEIKESDVEKLKGLVNIVERY